VLLSFLVALTTDKLMHVSQSALCKWENPENCRWLSMNFSVFWIKEDVINFYIFWMQSDPPCQIAAVGELLLVVLQILS